MGVPPLLPPGGMGDFSSSERCWSEWGIIGFSPQGHPMAFHRAELTAQDTLSCEAFGTGRHIQMG